MPLINKALPNLIGGVSQQPDVQRFEGQCEEQENALSSVVDGLSKRPQTQHVAELLSQAIEEDSFVHFINRGADEKYVVIHNGVKLCVYNAISGQEATVNTATSGGYSPSLGQYLYSSQPIRDMSALTIGDNTFLLNKTVPVSIDSEQTADIQPKMQVFIKQGDYEKKYGLRANSAGAGGGAAIGLSTTPYLYSSDTSGKAPCHRYYYRHRVTGVSIINAGAGYPDGQNTLNIRVTSTLGIYQEVTFNTTVTNGALTSISIANPTTNSYEGSGYIRAHHWSCNGGDYNKTPPTLTPTVLVNTASAFDLSGTVTSGTASAGGINADTTQIAKILTEEFHPTLTDASGGVTNTDTTQDDDFGDYFDVQRIGHNIILTLRSHRLTGNQSAITAGEFNARSEDGLGGDGLGVVYKQVNSITDLPIESLNGFKVKISGDSDSAADDYYAEFVTNDGADFGRGSWVECAGFKVLKRFDKETMPHSLLRTGENEFTIAPLEFADRLAGDDISNPMPSFVGKEINNIFLYKDRLGLLCEDKVVLSEAGLGVVENGIMNYNFFRTTTTTSLDSDPIDVTVSSGRVTNLKAAVGFQENLVLFSDNGQFVLKSGDLLTAASVSITPITNFEFDTDVQPLAIGSYIYFPFNRGSYTGIREFTVNSSTDNYDAQEITEHVPTYIPSDLNTLIGSTSEDIIIGLAPSTPDTLYIYKYFWSGTKKLLSAWSKFTFPFEVRGFDIMEGTAYIVAVKEGKTHLVTMPLQSGIKDAGANYTTYLDMRKKHTPSEIAINGTFEQSGDGWLQNFTGSQQGLSFTYKGAEIDTDLNTSNGIVYLQRNSVMAIGTTYKLTYTITEASNADIRLQNGNGSNTAPNENFTLQNTVGTHTQYFTKAVNAHFIIRVHAGQVTFSKLKLEPATSTVPLGFTASAGDKLQVWSDEGTLLKEQVAVGNETTLALTSPKAGWFSGISYKMKYTFSEQVFKAAAGNSSAPSAFVRAQIRNGVVFFNDTAGFTISVTPDKRDASTHTYSNPYSSFTIGASQVGELNLQSNSFKFPVFTDAFDTVITLENESALPANFSSAEFEMFVHERSKRFG